MAAVISINNTVRAITYAESFCPLWITPRKKPPISVPTAINTSVFRPSLSIKTPQDVPAALLSPAA